MTRGRQEPLETRFWALVEKTDTCWLWRGSLVGSMGYGSTSRMGKHLLAHRVSWELANGEIPKGKHVLHRCDVPACVNPAHLFLGTLSDNMKDASSKGRVVFQQHPEIIRRGEAHHNTTLTRQQVREIREQYPTVRNYTTLGRKYGVHRTTIRRIIQRKVWADVE